MEQNRSQSLLPSIIVGASLIISSSLLSSGIKEYGRSVVRAAQTQPNPMRIPDRFSLSFEGGNSPVRFESRETQ